MTQQELQARVAYLEAQLAAKNKTSINLSDAGYVEVYGIPGKGRFSMSCTPDGWDRLFAMQADIQGFCKANLALSLAKQQAYRAAKPARNVG